MFILSALLGKLFYAFRHHVEILKTDHAVAAFLTPPEIEGILKHWDLKERKIIDILGVGESFRILPISISQPARVKIGKSTT